jgi:hypothetical protein
MKLLRSFLLAAAAGVSYLGYLECRNSLERPIPCTLTPSALGGLKAPDPVWVRLEGRFLAFGPLVRAAESGGDKATWLPIAAVEEPEKVICVLEVQSTEQAEDISFRERCELFQPLVGLARLPSGKDEAVQLENFAASCGFSIAPRCRVLEVGRKPLALPLSLGFLVFGALGVVAAGLWPWPRGAAPRRSGASPARQELLVSPAIERYLAREVARAVARSRVLSSATSNQPSAPLPPEVKDEVAQMVADAWDRAA